MKKMLKRADGSKSRRGLWDNIRAKAAANKKSGKKGKAPGEAMLEQEAKIKAEMKMGGNWMQDSKELKFGGPTKYQTGNAKEEVTPTPTYTKFTVSPMEPEKKEKLSGESRGGRTAGSGSNFGQKDICVGKGCDKVIDAGSNDAGYQGKGAPGLSYKPQYGDRLANLTEDEKIAGIENKAKYDAEAEMRKEGKKYEAYLRSGKGDYSTGMDPEMVKDKGSVGTKFYTRQKTGGKRKSNKK
jgi:hypothetical protein